jgi:Fe-S-cluster-containing hydrogenase component 2
LARIKVVNLYETGIDAPVVCVQCAERYCLACPEDALTIGSEGQIIYSATACSLCGLCEQYCPLGAIEMVDNTVVVCDVCGGNPRCVEACTEGALTYRPQEDPISLRDYAQRSEGKNPAQKREQYVRDQGEVLRTQWREHH